MNQIQMKWKMIIFLKVLDNEEDIEQFNSVEEYLSNHNSTEDNFMGKYYGKL